MEPVNAAVIYYSATGTVHALAGAAAQSTSPPRSASSSRR